MSWKIKTSNYALIHASRILNTRYDVWKSVVVQFLCCHQLFGAHDVPNTFTSGAADAKYKAFRKTFAVAFSSDNLKKKFPALVKKAYEVADVVSENIENAIDYQELGVKFSFDSIGIFAYDLEFDSVKEGHPLLTSLEHCTLECTLDSINPLRRAAKKYLPFLDFAKKSKSEFNSLYLEYEKIFDHVNLYGDAPGEEDKSIRACLMRLRNPLRNDDKATPDELMSELSLFVFAGTDTTGHQIAWAMMWISENKEVQHKVYNELKAQGLAGAGARKVEYSDLAKLTYLKMLIMEIMRLTPAAQGRLARKIRQDMNVMGYRLPKGTMVGGSVLAQNRAPWLWKDPEVFKPERWEKGDEEVGTGQSKVRGGGKELWSFGVGVRDCVGQRLAMMELQMVIAILLSRFTFELDPRMGGLDGALKQSYNAVVQVCDGGMWVRAKRRLDSTPVVS